MKKRKHIISPGERIVYFREDNGLMDVADFTAERNKRICDNSNAMLAAGNPCPVPLEHDPSVRAGLLTEADKNADNIRNNTGWVDKFEVDKNGKLYAWLDIKDEEVAKKLPNTIKFVSPYINSFIDGKGKKFRDVISHVALTTRPRVTNQEPFTEAIAASLKMPIKVEPTNFGTGMALSKAMALISEAGLYKPKYPKAFSVLTKGVKPPKDDEVDVEEVDDEEVGDEGDTEEFEEEETVEKKPKKRPMPMDGETEKGFEQACDIGFATMIEHLLKVIGMNPPPGMTEKTFERDLYETLMARAKELATKGQNADNKPAADPMAKPQKDMGNNPILQESPPMYASLEEVNKIQDPEKRAIASAYFSLQEERKKDRADLDALKAANEAAAKKFAESEKRANAAAFSILDDAKRRREDRIAKVKARLPKKNRDMLDKFLANPAMSLSLADTGNVVDPMLEQIEFAESIADAIPELLREGAAKLSNEEPHPRWEGAPMTDQRSDEIVDSLTGGKKK